MNLFPLKLARKYIFSGKNAIEVNVISWIALLALGFVSTCLIVILSVFSGLEKINLQFYVNINPDIRIEPQKGKSFIADAALIKKIRDTPGVESYSRVIEERAFIDYLGKNHIITIKGIDRAYNKILGIDTLMLYGAPLDFDNPQSLIIGSDVSTRIGLYVDDNTPVKLYVPKPGKGIITSKEQAFNQVEGYSQGIFRINDKYYEYVFSNLSLAQQLLSYNKNQVSAIEMKINDNGDKVKKELQQRLGAHFKILTKKEMNAAFMKMMNTEHLIIYLIFILVLFIASFNLAGSVAILIINKKNQSKTLKAMGMSLKGIKTVFFHTGVLISFYALIFGIIGGTALLVLQTHYGLVKINQALAFPVRITVFNYLVTIVSVLGIGSFISWVVSRKVKI